MNKEYLRKLRQRVLNFVTSTNLQSKQDEGCELIVEIRDLLNQAEELKVMDFVTIEVKIRNLFIN